MKIIAGRAKGRALTLPEGRATRPTLGRARESLFSMLSSRIDQWEELRVLDLFAGSGGLGLEAWSRGSKEVYLIDKDSRALKIIHQNAAALGAKPEAQILRGKLPNALRRVSGRFDLVFLDPPYNKGLLKHVVRGLFERALLSPEAWLVLEHEEELEELPAGLDVDTTRRFGVGMLTLARPSR